MQAYKSDAFNCLPLFQNGCEGRCGVNVDQVELQLRRGLYEELPAEIQLPDPRRPRVELPARQVSRGKQKDALQNVRHKSKSSDSSGLTNNTFLLYFNGFVLKSYVR